MPGKPARPLCSEDARLQPAARPVCAPGQLRPNNAPGAGLGGGYGAGGFAAAVEGAGLDSPGARRWKLPSIAGCTTPGCGRGEGAQWGRACVRRGSWPRRRRRGAPGGSWRQGALFRGWGYAGAREWRSARDGLLQVGAKEDRQVRPGWLLCPPPSVSSLHPLGPLTQRCFPRAFSCPPLSLERGAPLYHPGLAPPFCGPGVPFQTPGRVKT